MNMIASPMLCIMRHIIVAITATLLLLGVYGDCSGQTLNRDRNAYKIVKPLNVVELLRNFKVAMDGALLLRDGFYTEDNLIQFSGGAKVMWRPSYRPNLRGGTIYDFGNMIAPWIHGGRTYEGLEIFFWAELGDVGGASVRWSITVRGPNGPDFSEVESIFGTRWIERGHEPQPHPPVLEVPTKPHGNARIIYKEANRMLKRESFFDFLPDATVGTATFVITNQSII